MKALMSSRNFNPGHFSHLIANAKLLKQQGYDIFFRWHERFDAMFTGTDGVGEKPAAMCLLDLRAGDLFVVWFPSVAVLFDMLLVRLCTRARIVYVYHEPFESVAAYRGAGFSWKKTLRIVIVSWVNRLLALCAHRIILPSTKAFETYQHKYHSKKPYANIPLMFDDESSTMAISPKRRLFSYIGTVAADHAFDRYVDFIEAALDSENMAAIDFLIATRSELDDAIKKRLEPGMRAGRVKIMDGRPLSNQEINDCYAQSWVVWNAYRRSMQSGVLPKAYMFGTPVLTTELNRSEFFANGRHGIEVGANYLFTEIETAVLNIRDNFASYSKSCRDMFMHTFHYEASAVAFMKLVL